MVFRGKFDDFCREQLFCHLVFGVCLTYPRPLDKKRGIYVRIPPFSQFCMMRLRSEEHTSELRSLMRISSAVFCLNKKHNSQMTHSTTFTDYIIIKAADSH